MRPSLVIIPAVLLWLVAECIGSTNGPPMPDGGPGSTPAPALRGTFRKATTTNTVPVHIRTIGSVARLQTIAPVHLELTPPGWHPPRPVPTFDFSVPMLTTTNLSTGLWISVEVPCSVPATNAAQFFKLYGGSGSTPTAARTEVPAE